MLQRIALAAGFVAGFLALAVLPSRADVIGGSGFSSGNWDGAAYDQDGAFSHCAITAAYKSGISLHFAVDKDYLWRMGLSHPNWNMRTGEQVSLRYQIDRHTPVSLNATVVFSDFLMAELPATSQVFNQFRHGSNLSMEAGTQFYTFSLQGTSKALARVLKCVDVYINYRPRAWPSPRRPRRSRRPPSRPPPSRRRRRRRFPRRYRIRRHRRFSRRSRTRARTRLKCRDLPRGRAARARRRTCSAR